MKFADRIRAAYKSFVGPDWISSDAPGNIYSSGRVGKAHWIPGTHINWDRLTGDLWECPAVQACLNWIYRNFPQAPPIIEQLDGKGEWSPIPDHPLLQLLTRPNPRYDGSILFQGLILSLETNGNGYAVIERTNGGQPAELWWAPHHRVTPYTAPGNDPRVVDYYDYWIGSTRVAVPPADMLHLKYGLDPLDERLGLAPLSSSTRDVNALQQAGNYRPNILRNFGVIGRMVSPDDENVTIDPTTVKDYIDANSGGDNNGRTLVFDFKAKVDYPKTSPQDMALTTLEDRPEADICALIGIPIQVTGLHGGRDAKTYANMREAREAAWEEKLIPLGSMLSQQIGHKFLPDFIAERDPAKLQKAMAVIRMNFDYRNIRPLQPDLDALHARSLKDWLANLLTLKEWCQAVGRPDPAPDVADLRYKDIGGQPQQINERGAQQNQLGDSPTPEPKGITAEFPLWSERIEKELVAIDAKNAVMLNGNGVH